MLGSRKQNLVMLLIFFTLALFTIGCQRNVKFNPPIGQVLLRDLGDIYKIYGYKFEVDDKLNKVINLCIERNVLNDDYGAVNVDEFNEQLSIYFLWKFGFKISFTIKNDVVTAKYADSDVIYEKLEKN